VQDWVVAPLMRSIDGVAGVDSIGGFEKQFLVQPDPARLTGYGLSFDSLIDALEAANLAAGANFVDRADEACLSAWTRGWAALPTSKKPSLRPARACPSASAMWPMWRSAATCEPVLLH